MLALLLTVTVLAAGAAAWGGALQKRETAFPNVRAAGVDVGGMTRQEVLEALSDAVSVPEALTVRLPDGDLTFDAGRAGAVLDLEAAADAVMAYGREGNPFSAVAAWAGGQPRDADLSTAMGLNTDYIRSRIDEAARAAALDGRSSAVTLDEAAGTLTIQVGTPAKRLDADGLFEAVCGAWSKGCFDPLDWDYEEAAIDAVNLDEYHASLCTAPRDAWYDADNHKIVEGTPGRGFDLEAARTQLKQAEPGSQVVVPIRETAPSLTAEQLTGQMFGQRLESRSSPYVSNADRTENLRLACEAVNGTIINPGEVFSFNDTVGQRTAERGYRPATVYADGGASVEDLGGGVCQVASTIFYTALYMDLEQVMREPHMYQVNYVPQGMDATVYWDSGLDYQFRNNRSHPIKIQANIDGGSVNITFWGVKENDNYVEMSSTVLSTFTKDDVEILDQSKPVGYRERTQTAYTGADVETCQKVYDGAGTLLTQRTFTSHYESRAAVYVVGPSEAPAVEEPPETAEPQEPDSSVLPPDPLAP